MPDIDMQLHLAILGTRDCYCIVAKNHGTNKTMTLWLKKEEVIDQAKRLNEQGFTVWVSLNDKEQGDDTTKGVRALQDLWFDIDSKRRDKSMPATKEELEEALARANKLLKSVEEQYGAVGFMALSGNGFHLHFPLPRFELVGEKFREEVNEKLRAFAKRLASAAGVEIDKTYDIRRVTTLIGSYNLKIPGLPLQTAWDKTVFDQGFDSALKAVEEAKTRNKALLEAILNEPIGSQAQPVLVQSRDHPPLEELLNKDEKLKDLYEGDWQKYGYPSRSEAEMALVTKLVFYGFSDGEIGAVMSNAKIGKWHERDKSYKELTIKKAKETVSQQLQEKKEKPSKEEINLYNLAKEIIDQTPIVTDKRTYLMYRWNGKVWMDDAEGHIHEKLISAYGDNFKPYHLTTLVQMIQGMTFVSALHEPPPSMISFDNGVLNLDTMVLDKHDSTLFFRNCIHADYKPGAKCEKFLAWLQEVLPDEEDRLLAQEISGYCFHRGYPLHHIFFLVGTGRNGKGVFVRTIQSLLGQENCANITLERINERFQATNLIGKLVNVVSEPDTKRLSVEMIKALTGQDLISAEVKGKQKVINFTNYAKFIIAANKLPPVNDKSNAWWERVVIVEFPIVIPEERRIANIEEKWLNDPEERSGIVNWALEGLKRILAKGKFTRSKRMDELKEEYKRWSNPVDYFLNKRCLFAPSVWIGKRELYDAYKDFAEGEELPIVSEDVFGREVRKQPKVKVAMKRVMGRLERVWVGIGLKPKVMDELGELSDTSDTTDTTDTPFSYSRKAYENIEDKGREEKEEEKERGERETYRSIENPVSVASDVSPRAECCANCQEFQADYSLCSLDGERKDPGFSCSRFTGKPPTAAAPGSQPPPEPVKEKLYRCTCGAGPWRDRRLADEHIYLCRNEPDHEIQEA